ncbi:MAG: RidA family protein [Solirubrobacterales bacterium]
MERRPINPSPWSIKLGFDQAVLIEGHERLLVCSGQDAVDADGTPQHPGDMAAQLELALDNLEAVLSEADMTLANVARLNAYTTDVDELFKHFPRGTDRFGDSRCATSVLGSRNCRQSSSSCWRQRQPTDPAPQAHPMSVRLSVLAQCDSELGAGGGFRSSSGAVISTACANARFARTGTPPKHRDAQRDTKRHTTTPVSSWITTPAQNEPRAQATKTPGREPPGGSGHTSQDTSSPGAATRMLHTLMRGRRRPLHRISPLPST